MEHGLVEIKSLSNYASLTPKEAAMLPDTLYSFLNGKFTVGTTHAYSYQAHGQCTQNLQLTSKLEQANNEVKFTFISLTIAVTSFKSDQH